MRRTDQRKEAVFALYQRDVTDCALSDLLADAKPFSRELAEGTDSNLEAIDAEISNLAQGWSLERIAPLERSILRVGLYELLHSDAVPAEIAIDEAIGLAHQFCGADAPSFVNGILGAAARQAGVGS